MKVNKIICIIALVVSCSCQSQEYTQEDILGNWYNYEIKPDKFYIETYFNEKYFQSYTDRGLLPSRLYTVKNNRIYLVPRRGNGNEEKIYGKIEFKEGIFNLNVNGEIVQLKKMEEEGSTLENFLNGKITEREYFKGFSLRKAIWEKEQENLKE